MIDNGGFLALGLLIIIGLHDPHADTVSWNKVPLGTVSNISNQNKGVVH